jgi:hypothetical protein
MSDRSFTWACSAALVDRQAVVLTAYADSSGGEEMAKRGPKTEAGKSIVRLNAVRHGVLSTTPVIPDLEREEDWGAHCVGLLASLAPEGHLEVTLAERVALMLWRLQRVARYERECIVLAQERVEDDLAASRMSRATTMTSADRVHPEEVRMELEWARDRVQILEHLHELPDDKPISGEDAADLAEHVAETGRVSFDDVDVPGLPEDLLPDRFAGWTARLLREAVNAIAAHARRKPEDLLRAAVVRARVKINGARREAERVAADLDRMRRERLLPDDDTLNKVVRYEAHLNRQLYQALHELEALQARRLGAPTPLARVDVHGLAEG